MSLCQSCMKWVTRDKKEGFCLVEDLFTNTNKDVCSEYVEGEPFDEEEWENWGVMNETDNADN